ncbi:MAG: VOC family protein [Thermoleophilaceae bacterium]|nr:VOC family protein [Thermoleophilaceae bacterium]
MQIKQLDHVGVLVDDIEEARAFCEETLGLGLDREATPPELGVHALFFRCGDVTIEVFEIIDPDSTIRPLEAGQRARIDHIALAVEDLGTLVEALAGRGVRPQPTGVGASATAEPLSLAGNLNLWTDAETSDGVVYQLVEKGTG